ncbi:MAG: hypothetical protein HFG06_07525 [Oscillibacter sp.]|nr:hypothetical protein [Oscillibacter sp.]
MRRFQTLGLVCLLALLSAGCCGNREAVLPDSPSPVISVETPAADIQEELPEHPVREAVLAAREKALEGMSPEQIDRLKETVKTANLWLEQGYLYDHLFGKLEDPDSLTWNYFDETGDIQIGWAYDGSLDMDAVCAQEGLTEAEFYSRYGTAVSAANDYTADDFITLMEELEASAQNENLKAELHCLAEEMALAKGHVMEHVNNVYKKLHDLDYFLLRYGPEVLDGYGAEYDKSTVSKYYGTLSFYA